jgi:hypothetical protein
MSYFAFTAFATEVAVGFWRGMAVAIDEIQPPPQAPKRTSPQAYFLRSAARLEAALPVVDLERVRANARRR